MSKIKLKTGDTVRVLAGEHKGQEGTVSRIFKDKNKAVVDGVNMVSKHQKPSANSPQGGIKQMEAPLHVSNLSLIDSNGKSTRTGYRFEDGNKVRFSKTTNEAI
jgi:large subunit ribosomal protein L24